MDKATTRYRSSPVERSGAAPRYVVDLGKDRARLRSAPYLIAARRCHACRQADDGPAMKSDPRPYIERIAEHCHETPDYLLPDTPLKEAIFRVILARGNRETTAEDVSKALSEQWSTSPYPRDVSSSLMRRLMDQGDFYCISSVPEPEPGSEPETGQTGA